MDHRGLVIADDLTGAADTGNRFAERGYDVVVATDSAPTADVLVVDTDSRTADAGTAADRVRTAIERHGGALVYKKVDSTLRGNVAAEIAAAIEAADAGLAIVCPAFPARGRTTVGGVHRLDGVPVPGDGAEGPSSPHLPTVLAATGYPVEHVPVDQVAGAAALEERFGRLAAGGPTVVACDATRRSHLETVAHAASRLDAEVIYAGSAGLAGHVRLDDPVPVLGVVGSTTPPSLDALSALPESVVVSLDGPRAVSAPDAAGRDAADAATGVLETEGRAVLTAAPTEAAVEETLSAGADGGASPETVRERVAQALAAAVRTVVDRRAARRLFLTGGATASATLAALEASGIGLTGREVEAGVPLGRIDGGAADRMPVVTKAGSFGGRETTLRCLDFLSTADG